MALLSVSQMILSVVGNDHKKKKKKKNERNPEKKQGVKPKLCQMQDLSFKYLAEGV